MGERRRRRAFVAAFFSFFGEQWGKKSSREQEKHPPAPGASARLFALERPPSRDAPRNSLAKGASEDSRQAEGVERASEGRQDVATLSACPPALASFFRPSSSMKRKTTNQSRKKSLTTAPATRAGRAATAERRPATAVGRTAATREARAKAIVWIRGG